MAVTIDSSKSWCWDAGNSKKGFDVSLQLATTPNARDLGASMRYGKQRSMEVFQKRESKA